MAESLGDGTVLTQSLKAVPFKAISDFPGA
jgi:hypothetical protein